MIIFFGIRNVVRDDPDGFPERALCPACRQVVDFRPRRARSYFHLFWVPLIPVSKPQAVRECPRCKARFVAHPYT